ncbi:MAG TPA: hypothetical protein VFP14_14590 [Novosphingobium sp.]|nr:hypothetical protein [Novosphingobium sp.]
MTDLRPERSSAIFTLNARSYPWHAICESILEFRDWTKTHSGYLYISCDQRLKRQASDLLRQVGLEEQFSFVDEVSGGEQLITDCPEWPLSGRP